ncbi:MAG: OmpA family protein [Rubrivivax sp.]|nr:OmpA family protein [Rubrivivax sp.]
MKLLAAAALACLCGAAVGQATTASNPDCQTVPPVVSNDRETPVDLGLGIKDAAELASGLFPEDSESAEQKADRERCERLRKSCFVCMPPARTYVRYNLPGANFLLGSAELPDLMKQQLQRFAQVFRGRKSDSALVRIDGHADASGTPEVNKALSARRATAVRDYLVSLGVSPGLLSVEGFGADRLLLGSAPTAPQNRRVEIARQLSRN